MDRSNLVSAPPPQNLRFKQAALLIGITTCLGLFFANKGFLISNDHAHPEFAKALWWNVMDWYGWVPLVPIIFWNCRKFAGPGRWIRFVLGHLVMGVAVALAHGAVLTSAAWIEALVLHTGRSWYNLWRHFIVFYHTFDDFVTYTVIVCAWHAIAYHSKFKERELMAAQLEAQLTRAELQALKTQLNPHFLFNTLHAIASLNYEDPRTANSMLAKLSDLLRITLADDAAQATTLGKELEFNRQYLELEQMRLGDRLSIELDTPLETLAAQVPSLLLQPLVENAVRHGIAPFSRPGRVFVRSRVQGAMLQLEVGDSGPGSPKPASEAAGHGIGLKNTRGRLQKIYGDGHRFEIRKNDPSGFLVQISIPFEKA